MVISHRYLYVYQRVLVPFPGGYVPESRECACDQLTLVVV